MYSLPAFLPAAALPSRTAPTARPRTAPRMSLSYHVSQRARADLALCADALSRVKRQAADLCAHSSVVLAAFAAASLVAMPVALANIPAKAPSSAFFDETSSISQGSLSQIEDAAAAIFRDDGVRVRIAFVNKVPYQGNVNDYARELATEWGLGEKDMLFVGAPKLSKAGVFMGVAVGLDGGIVKSVTDDTFAAKAGNEQYGGAWLDVCNRLNDALNEVGKSGSAMGS